MGKLVSQAQEEIDGLNIAIAKLTMIDDTPSSRKLTAAAFLAEAFRLGATPEGVVAVEADGNRRRVEGGF